MNKLFKTSWFNFILGTLWTLTFILQLVAEKFSCTKTYLFVYIFAALLFYCISLILFIKKKSTKEAAYEENN